MNLTAADFMKDSQGRLVPLDLVKPIDKQRDELVSEIIAGATELNQQITTYKRRCFADIQSFVDLSAEQFGINYGGSKGNITLTSYDGTYKVIRAMDEYNVFDERLQIAKQLIDQCIHRWAQGSSLEMTVLIQDAFQVDKMGRVNIKRILGLRRLAILDEQWQQAMTAIAESLQVAGTKEYLRIYKKNEQGGYDQISLDIAK